MALLGILICATAGQADQTAQPAAAAAALDRQAAAGLEVFPPDINLETARDRQSFVVQAHPARRHHPRRHRPGASSSSPTPRWPSSTGNVVRPLADGATELTVTFNGQTAQGAGRRSRTAKVDRPI